MTATNISASPRPPAARKSPKPAAPREPGRDGALLRRLTDPLGALLVVVALAALWEGYKAFGRAVDDRFLGLGLPVATDDLSMPHLWTIVGSLAAPARAGDSTSLAVYLIGETTVTLREALYGLGAGSLLGLVLAVLFVHVAPLNRGLMPWLVASQTVPLVAIAPMIVIWGGKAGLPPWAGVTGIAAYLAFFPVTVNSLRGLKSPPTVQLDFMRSVGAGQLRVLWSLRFPAALPYVFAGLRLAATASVVGAIVGELSAGTGRGIGRAILTSAYYYSNGPEKLYAAVLVAAIAGILFVQVLALLERFALRHRHAR
ncbi:ABC transporter permease [Streptomyces tagetis]|uniref:ABC transporter permease subunit n=1 Tax=Streptomyces tagetis TaxID=2820809 RepID=A0A940XK19_9ACTN|nr:ABC transporter permease subunit [Streptomyces sp. RG38]MBQ0828892.1 ABC transporter permease subunit [Streptomyces sp. RG38]